MARRATAIAAERAKGEVLLLDAGNSIFGTYTGNPHGKAAVAAMNALKYDAMTIGDDDLVVGLDLLRQRMSEANFPFLSANVVDTSTNQLIGKPYIIKQIAGVKVGILGLTRQATAPLATPTGAASPQSSFIITDPLEAAKKYLPELQKQADYIILLSSLGSSGDKQIIKDLPEIAIIVGGHSRTSVYPPEKLLDTNIYRVEAGQQGEKLGYLKIEMNPGQSATLIDAHAIDLDATIKDDPDLKKLVDNFKQQPG